VERVKDVGDFLEVQMFVATAGYSTVQAPKVAPVGQHQTTDERDALMRQMVTQYVLNAPGYGFHDELLPPIACTELLPRSESRHQAEAMHTKMRRLGWSDLHLTPNVNDPTSPTASHTFFCLR
jgi:hypothetical protein